MLHEICCRLGVFARRLDSRWCLVAQKQMTHVNSVWTRRLDDDWELKPG
jgi:hypothetical protein